MYFFALQVMEPALNVRKRKSCELQEALVTKLCLICQTKKDDEATRAATSAGLATLKDALSKRTKLNCDKYVDVIKILNSNNHIFNEDSMKFVYHKSCFSSFTSKTHLDRLAKRHGKSLQASSTPSETNEATPRASVSRSAIPPVDFDKCIFCQKKTSECLRQVLTLETSEKLTKHKDSNISLSLRLAGVTDLVAAEVKYHLPCYSRFFRTIAVMERESKLFPSEINQPCFTAVMEEMQDGLHAGNVYSVKTVWERYLQLVSSTTSKSDHPKDSNAMRCFRNEIQKHFGDKIDFIAPEAKCDSLFIFPTLTKDALAGKLTESAVELDAKEAEQRLLKSITLDTDCDFLKSVYHVGTTIRSELQNVMSHKSYDGIDIPSVEKIVPPNLFLLLSVIVGNSENNNVCREKIFSIAQDVIYVASGGRKLTPKHVGLASTVHHATRSKSLVQLLNAAGHCASYETVEKTDTSIAKNELERWTENGGLVVPSNLEYGKFTQFAGDNINISVETLDGKGMFNATQYAAFQYGAQESNALNGNREIGSQRSFGPSLPPEFHETLSSGYTEKKRPAPIFPLFSTDWFESTNECLEGAKAKDLAWLLCRNSNSEAQQIPSWTGFNHVVSTFESEITTVGHMPIIPAPADEMDTVYTVLARCKAISRKLGQTYTVITFDQALYCRAKEVVWCKKDEFENVIIRLGGFHTAMNFMKAIGQHMDSSGLRDVWIESGVYGENTTLHMLSGHAYNKAVRAHKLTFEALWRSLWPKFQEWAVQNGKALINEELSMHVDKVIEKFAGKCEDVTDSFCELVRAAAGVIGLLQEFDESQSGQPTFKYWRQYMEMVSILMGFIRAEREGNWALHLELFCKMLPWFAIYDHTNYSRWGPVYLADMMALPTTAPEVHREFIAGCFSIKRTEGKFKQVASDQALEHVNRIAKVSGGLVGITHLDSARDRWCLTYNERARISDDTLGLFGLQHEDTNDDWSHRDTSATGIKRDEEDIRRMMGEFNRFQVFSRETPELMSLSTNDIVPDEITNEILSAERKGHSLVSDFVKSRLHNKDVEFYSRIPQVKAKTIGSMYKSTVQVKKDAVSIVKAERDIFRRLLVVRDSGRDVDLASILKHELSPVPYALASTNRKLDTPKSKSDLAKIIADSVDVIKKLPKSTSPACLLVDGPALIQAIGKPDEATTFGDLADKFVDNILGKFRSGYTRVDVLFDRYNETSIKDGTRENRSGNAQGIRRRIDSRSVKLPQNWSRFISLPANKSELAAFLSNELMCCNVIPSASELVLGGGFSDVKMVWSSRPRSVSHLSSDTEEADTRLLLHARDASTCGYKRVVISCRDTDVLVLALGHRAQLSPEVWFHSGTAKDPKYTPIHSISLAPSVIENLIAFHAVTGCDTTSQFAGKGKRTCWKVFLKEPELLKEIGEAPVISENARLGAEKFVCHLYGHGVLDSVDDVRHKMFVKGKCALDGLPPTQDALSFHLQRCNHQAFIWKGALTNTTVIPNPDGHGWTLESGKLTPVLMSLESVPKACLSLVSCCCKKECNPKRCGCRKAGFAACTSSCHCEGLCQMDIDD